MAGRARLARARPAAKDTCCAAAAKHAGPSPLPAGKHPGSQTTTLAAAPQTVQLSGTVLGPDGRPYAGVSVYPAGAPRQLVVTDANGAFKLAVPAGIPTSLRVEYFGVGSSRVEVPLPSTTPLQVTLGQ